MLGMSKRCVSEQRTDSSERGITSACAISPLLFKVVEEGADEWRIKIANVKLRRLDTSLLGREDQQQPQGVSVGRECMRASLTLAYQAFREERLQSWGKSGHVAPPRCRSRRCPTSVINSGAAERYQYVLTGSTCPR